MTGVARLARIVIVRADGTCDTAWLVSARAPDLVDVECLARLQLTCRRGGGHVRLEEVSEQLQALLDLTGLRRELSGEAEDREELVGFEEGVDSADTVP